MKGQELKYVLLTILFILVGVGFVKNTVEIRKKGHRPAELREEIRLLSEERERLEQELENKQQDSYIEREARNKLNLIKPNERIFVVDGGLTLDSDENVTVDSGGFLVESDDKNVSGPARLWLDLLL